LRQEGFYVDKIKTPLEIDEKEYNEVLVRINGMRTFVLSLIDSFKSDDKEFNKHLEKLKKQFLKEGWYQKIGGLIELFNDRKTNPLENLSLAINEFSNEIASKKHLMNSHPRRCKTFVITPGLLIYFGVRELRFAQANAQTRNCKRAFTFPSL